MQMHPGIRQLRSASLMLSEPESVPAHMRPQLREVSALYVPTADRRKGYAAELLDRVCDEANACGMTLMLIVRPYEEGITQAELESFYERHGFKKIQEAPTVLMAKAPLLRAANLVLAQGIHRGLH